jgi:putative Holliday junction resolvase
MSGARKFIGLDVGEVRIGVAAGDSSVKIAFPLEIVLNDALAPEKITQISHRENAELIVIGLPRNSHGEETAQSAFSRAFASKLEKNGLKTVFEDESLTSVMAEARLKSRKKPYSKGDIDKEAAAIILTSYLESSAPTPIVAQTDGKVNNTNAKSGEIA